MMLWAARVSLTPITCPLLRDVLLQAQPQLCQSAVPTPKGAWLHKDEVGEIAIQGTQGSLDAALIRWVVDGGILLCQEDIGRQRPQEQLGLGLTALYTPCWGPGQGFSKASESPPLRQREAGLLGRGASLK